MEHTIETILHACQHVSYYREKCIQQGINVESAEELCRLAEFDFTSFPFTTKNDLRKSYPYGAFAQDQRSNIARVHVSSGSTGTPTVVGHTMADLKDWRTIMVDSLKLLGVRSDDSIYIAFPYGLGTGGLGVHDAAQSMGCCVIPASTLEINTQVQQILDLEPTIVCATPSYAAAMGEHLAGRQNSVRTLICGAEAWSAAMRERLEELWGAKVLNIYGLSEILGPGVATESPDHPDMLLGNDYHFFFEIVDPLTSLRVENGTFGELVITTLTRDGMPLIRYKTGDWTRIISTSPTILDRIVGRIVDRRSYGSIELFPSEFEKVLFSFPEVDSSYSIKSNTLSFSSRIPMTSQKLNDLERRLSQALTEEFGKGSSIYPLSWPFEGRWSFHNLTGGKANRLRK